MSLVANGMACSLYHAAYLLTSGVAFAGCSLFDSGNGLEQLWRQEATSEDFIARQAGVDDRHFYVLRGVLEARLVAFRLDDGAQAWSAPISNACTPIVTDGGRVFCPSERLHAFDAATGRELWAFTPDSALYFAEGAAADGRVYVGSLTTAYALDAETGTLLWQRPLRAGDWLGARLRALVPAGDTLFASVQALYSENGYLSASAIVALDAATGRELWRFQDGDGTANRKIGGLTVAGDVLLYSDPEEGQQFVAVDRATRAVRWRVPRTPGYLGTLRAPLVRDGVAYSAEGDEHVYALDVQTGAVRWKVRPDRGSYRNHGVCGNYVVAANAALAVVERASGQRVDVLFTGRNEYVVQTAVRDDRLYVATTRAVYAYACR